MNQSTPRRDPLEDPAATLKVLAHPTRLRIVQHLSKKGIGEQSVTEVYTALDAPQAIISQHLITLKDRGILQSQKVGTKIFYSIAQPWVVQVLTIVLAQARG